MDTILIVDDIEMNRALLAKALEGEYRILEAENGEEALRLISIHFKELSLVLLDIKMPKIDGFQVLNILRKKNAMKYIPVIIITGDKSQEALEKGYEMGAADFITKPFNMQVVQQCVKNISELYKEKNQLETITIQQNQELKEQAEQLKKWNVNIMNMFGTIVEFRGLESTNHIQKVKEVAALLAEAISRHYTEFGITEKEIELIRATACMHDIGKIVIPDTILLKPGVLTEEEFEVMRSHTTKGSEMIEAAKEYQNEEYYQYSYDICRYHHERFDGMGYPEGLSGTDIPVSAQIVAVAEVFDALITDRVYKEAVSVEEAFRMILEGECGVFSPKILECFRLSKDKLMTIINQY